MSVTGVYRFTCSVGTRGLGKTATDKVGKSETIERRTNTLLVLVFSLDLLTTRNFFMKKFRTFILKTGSSSGYFFDLFKALCPNPVKDHLAVVNILHRH